MLLTAGIILDRYHYEIGTKMSENSSVSEAWDSVKLLQVRYPNS